MRTSRRDSLPLPYIHFKETTMLNAPTAITCATCREGRASPSGRVACALLNSTEKLRAIAGRRIRTQPEVFALISAILPPGTPILTGWAYLDAPYSDSAFENHPSAAIDKDCYLLEPSSSCCHAKKRDNLNRSQPESF